MDITQYPVVTRVTTLSLLLGTLSGCDLFNKDDDDTEAPEASFSVNENTGTAPVTVAFTDTSEDGSDDIYQWLWEFGDGNTSSLQNPQHDYPIPGTYTVSLTVTSEDGADTETRTDLISVEALPPVAAFSVSTSAGDAPLTVTLSDDSTQGTGQINQWQWDFGDGNTSTESSPAHTYTEPGEYTVSLTVSDEYSSHTVTATEPVVVTEAPPTELTLIDSPVNGVSYECGGNTGVTEQGGNLYCYEAPVTFFVGNMAIGTLTEFPEDLNVYLQDLVGVSRGGYNDAGVVKLGRLLQSLDDDGLIAEAIDITAETAAKFSAGDSLDDELDILAETAAVKLVSEPFAIAHLKRSYQGGDDATEYQVDVVVEDASQTSFVVTQPVQLNLVGAEVLNSELVNINYLELDGGLKIASLFLRNPPQELQDLKIIAKADGYLDTGTSLVLSENQKRYAVRLKMVKDQPGFVAEGVLVAKEDISEKVSDGIVTEQIVAETEPDYPALKLKVTVPEGTVMTDDEGNLINAEEMTLVNFNPYAAEALEAYPGGLDVIANVGGFEIDGEVQSGQAEINFKTAGFATITIADSEGNKAKHFSQNLEVAMQFYTGTLDADGNVVQVGDEVPIWGYNEDNGEWSFEKNGVVQDLDVNDGFLDVVYEVNHLSSFNLDWHWGERCRSSTFNIIDASSGDELSLLQLAELQFVLTINSAPEISRLFPGRYLDSSRLQFENSPANFPGLIKVYANDSEYNLGQAQFSNVCENNVSTIDVLVDLEGIFGYERAKEILAELRSRSLAQKQLGIQSITREVKTIGSIIENLSAQSDPRATELLNELMDVVHSYTGALMDKTYDVYQERLSSSPFINSNIEGFTGYGCIQYDLGNYLDEIVLNHTTYKLYGGTGPYSLIDMVGPFLTRAAEEYIAFLPGTLAYSAFGVSKFVECGNDLYRKLQQLSVGNELGQQILEHYEPVIMLNVLNMRSDVDTELAVNLANNGSESISESTAATFEFILTDAMNVATSLNEDGLLNSSRIAEIQAQIDFLQALRDSGKVNSGGGVDS